MSKHDSTCAHNDLPNVDGVQFGAIADHPRYAIGSDGSVWSRSGRVPGARRGLWNKWKRLNPWVHKSGHLYVRLNDVNWQVHRLVLTALVGYPPSELAEARHLNGQHNDNRLENLAWGTKSENMLDQSRLGVGNNGEGHYCAKLDARAVAAIKELRKRHPGYSGATTFLSRWYGVHTATITDVAIGRTWNGNLLRR